MFQKFQPLFFCMPSASCKSPDSLTNQIGNSLITYIYFGFKLTTLKEAAHTTLLSVYNNTGRKINEDVQKDTES